MGYVKVKAKLWDVKRLRSLDTELIADTGAIYTGVPSDTLKKLGIEPTGKRKFKLANGNVKEYETGEAYIEIAGEGVTSLVAFLPIDAMPLLGATTLELLGLKVNPITGELEPMELLLL